MAVVNLAAWTIRKKRSSHPLLCMGLDQYLFRSILGSPKSDFCGKHFRRKRKKKDVQNNEGLFFSSIYVLKCSFTITTEKETFCQRIFTMLGRLEWRIWSWARWMRTNGHAVSPFLFFSRGRYIRLSSRISTISRTLAKVNAFDWYVWYVIFDMCCVISGGLWLWWTILLLKFEGFLGIRCHLPIFNIWSSAALHHIIYFCPSWPWKSY